MVEKSEKEEKKEGAPAEPELPKKQEEGVRVPEGFLERVEQEIGELKRQNDILMQIADKKALSNYLARQPVKESARIAIREYAGKIVVGWRSLQDDVYYDSAKRAWVENQRVKLLYEDGTSDEMFLRDFELRFVKVMCKRMGVVTNDETGKTAFKLARLDTGKEYTIGAEYVN